MRVSQKIAATSLVVAFLISGCASRIPELDYDSLDERPPDEVIQQWEARREVLVRVVKDKKFTIREFNDALDFFERVTGLPASQDSTRYGTMPNDRLPVDLERWDDWFRANGGGLRASDLARN